MNFTLAALERLQARVEELEARVEELEAEVDKNHQIALDVMRERDALRERAEKAEAAWRQYRHLCDDAERLIEQANSGAASTPESPLGGGHP